MPHTLSLRFPLEAAHTLRRERSTADAAEQAGSRRIHGHTYWVEVAVAGSPNPSTGMVLDLSHLREAAASLRETLDHRLLDEVPGLGPATLENLCSFIWRSLQARGLLPSQVRVSRDGWGDACTLTD